MICLGRAIIKKTKILVLDEATANVDLQTDNFIQEFLKTSFKESTVMIIAHRLATVIDSDRILVMNAGRSEEYNHPYLLLVKNDGDDKITNTDGYFAKMIQATGVETSKSLFKIA